MNPYIAPLIATFTAIAGIAAPDVPPAAAPNDDRVEQWVLTADADNAGTAEATLTDGTVCTKGRYLTDADGVVHVRFHDPACVNIGAPDGSDLIAEDYQYVREQDGLDVTHYFFPQLDGVTRWQIFPQADTAGRIGNYSADVHGQQPCTGSFTAEPNGSVELTANREDCAWMDGTYPAGAR